jgi:hypothetical protein
MNRRDFALLSLSALVFPLPARAHHGWGSYDAQNPITLKGPIKKIEFINPHVHVEMVVSGKEWELTFAPPFRMQSRGAVLELLPVGKTITAAMNCGDAWNTGGLRSWSALSNPASDRSSATPF